jgi:transposase-like protein
MKQTPPSDSAEQYVREIRRKTRKQYSSEEKIRIVISGLRCEHSIAELCQRQGIAESLCYVWSKEFPELSPRELAVTFIDEKAQFISEASVYRLLRANGLLTSPAYIVMKAADEFKDKTTAPNQLWQTDFTYLKVIGWG